MKFQLNESGIQNMRQIAKDFTKAIIYFHIDLDGVTSAICAKEYLKQYGIQTIAVQKIQYGDNEWIISKPEDGVLAVLVDFSHGKPFMKIHTDHHSSQLSYQGTSHQFRHSKSNADTLSSIISTKNIFSEEDIRIINMVDSAGYASENVSPEEMLQIMLKVDKSKDSWRNHIQMGMVVGKLLLTYKNKPDYLEKIVMESKPSLISMYLTMMKIIKEHISNNDKGWYGLEALQKNSDEYKKKQEEKILPNARIEDIRNMVNGSSMLIGDTIVQFGGGYMSKVGMYDRYTAYRLFPESKYFIMMWDKIGMIQVSKNPWDLEKNDIDLGELVLNKVIRKKYKHILQDKKYNISLLAIKMGNENKINEENEEEAIGYKFDNFEIDYPKPLDYMSDKQKYLVKKYMNWKPSDFVNSDPKEVQRAIDMLSRYYISLYDIIMHDSGGHPSITNISGIGYLEIQKQLNKKIRDGLNPYVKQEKPEEEKQEKNNQEYIHHQSEVERLIKSIAKSIVSELEHIKPINPFTKRNKDDVKIESLSNERQANRIVLEYMKNFDSKAFENIPQELNEDIYNALSRSYEIYDHRRHLKTKREFFSSLVESLKNDKISSELKTLIKNILI